MREIFTKKQFFFRNFKRPMAVQDKKNEQHYINNYNVSGLIMFIKKYKRILFIILFTVLYSISNKLYRKV